MIRPSRRQVLAHLKKSLFLLVDTGSSNQTIARFLRQALSSRETAWALARDPATLSQVENILREAHRRTVKGSDRMEVSRMIDEVRSTVRVVRADMHGLSPRSGGPDVRGAALEEARSYVKQTLKRIEESKSLSWHEIQAGKGDLVTHAERKKLEADLAKIIGDPDRSDSFIRRAADARVQTYLVNHREKGRQEQARQLAVKLRAAGVAPSDIPAVVKTATSGMGLLSNQGRTPTDQGVLDRMAREIAVKASGSRGGMRKLMDRAMKENDPLMREVLRQATHQARRLVRVQGDPGDYEIPFGKFRGQKLKDLPTYYLGYLEHQHDQISDSQTRAYVGAFLDRPYVRRMLEEHFEDQERSSPSDLRPYQTDYRPDSREIGVGFREFDKRGFGPSLDKFLPAERRVQMWRGVRYFSKKEDREVLGMVPDGVVGLYGPRRGEQRWPKGFDPQDDRERRESEFQADVQRTLFGRKRGPADQGGGAGYTFWRKKLDEEFGAVPEQMEEVRSKRWDRKTRTWVDVVRMKDRNRVIRQELNLMARELAEGEGAGVYQKYIDDLMMQQRIDRSQNRIYGIGKAAMEEGAMRPSRGYRATQYKVDLMSGEYEILSRGYGKPSRFKDREARMEMAGYQIEGPGEEGAFGRPDTYAYRLLRAGSMQEVQDIVGELEEEFGGLRNLRSGDGGLMDRMIKDSVKRLVVKGEGGL